MSLKACTFSAYGMLNVLATQGHLQATFLRSLLHFALGQIIVLLRHVVFVITRNLMLKDVFLPVFLFQPFLCPIGCTIH